MIMEQSSLIQAGNSSSDLKEFLFVNHNKEGEIKNKKRNLFLWLFFLFLISLIGFFLFIWFFN